MKKTFLFVVMAFLVLSLQVRGQGKEPDNLNQLLEMVLVSVLMVLVIFLILRNRNRMKRANALLAKKNAEITLLSEQLSRLKLIMFWFTLPSATVEVSGQPEHEPIVIGHTTNLQLSVEEKEEISGTCALLKAATIYAISDVKEVLHNLNSESPEILEWKRLVLHAVSDCNETRFNELISICE